RVCRAKRLDDAAAGVAQHDLGHPFVADGVEEWSLPVGGIALPRRIVRPTHAAEDECVRVALLMLDRVLAQLEHDQVREAANVALLELRRRLEDRARLGSGAPEELAQL